MRSIGFHRVRPDSLLAYLGGRRPQPGVKYYTAVNHGKKYPYSSKRQNERHQRRV